MKVCVITGASRGIGLAILKEFKKNGFFTVNLSRSKSPEASLNIKVDLSKSDDTVKGVSQLLQEVPQIDILVNNAGIGLYETWEEMSMEDLRKVFEVNFFAPVILTKSLLPFLKETNGTIINVSSVAGKLYVPYMGGYSASKFALNAFSDSLRAEIKKYNVHVLNLIVGRIDTGFSNNALGSKKPPETFGGSATTEKLARVAYKAYIKRKREIVYPKWYRPLIWIANLFPSIYDRVALKSWEKANDERGENPLEY